jgi:hypothetical protein
MFYKILCKILRKIFQKMYYKMLHKIFQKMLHKIFQKMYYKMLHKIFQKMPSASNYLAKLLSQNLACILPTVSCATSYEVSNAHVPISDLDFFLESVKAY